MKNKIKNMMQALVAPNSLLPLEFHDSSLHDAQGGSYKILDSRSNVVDFMRQSLVNEQDKANLNAYNSTNSADVYRNFLEWLFLTFETNELEFRERITLLLHLSEGHKVLIVGCGLGEDIPILMNRVGVTGEVHAQDISKAMVLTAANKYLYENILFTVSNANTLPYASNYFDAVFHFGGINLFGDIEKSIYELDRVCKKGGRVVFGDEGIADHLIGTEYYEIAVNNNNLWSKRPPMHDLPNGAVDIQLNYELGNCFYLISFTSGDSFPYMNIDVPHKGLRGGTARTRYFGRLEGVTEETKSRVQQKAKELNISVHDLLERLLNSKLDSSKYASKS